jgi:hypothetical protein
MKDNLNVDIRKNSTAVICEECENETFNNVSFIRKISKLYTGSTSDSVVPVPTFQCSECKHINKEFTINFSK